MPAGLHEFARTSALSLAVTFGDVFTWLLTCVAMAAIGVVVWKLVQRQEAADPKFLKKLDDDDERARRSSGS
ncbi:MAG: hypothetical protein U0572_02405 [Phycisphaerales bacterium]